MVTIYENSTGNDWQTLYNSAWRSDGIATILSLSYKPSSITVYLERSGSPSGDIQAHIYTCSAATTCDSAPTYSSNETVSASSIATSETAYTFTFSGTANLTAEDRIVITATGGDASNYVRMRLTSLSLVSNWARTADNASSGWYQNTSQNIKGSVEGQQAPVASGLLLPPPYSEVVF